MSTLAILAITAALVALTLRICRARDYGTDAPAPSLGPEQARRRGGRVYLGCWRVA